MKAFARKGVSFVQIQEQPRDLEIVMFWQKSATPPPVLQSFLDVAHQVVRRPRKV